MLGAPVLCHGRDWVVEECEGGFSIERDGQIDRFPAPNLEGRHQFDNAASAIVTLRWVAETQSNSRKPSMRD